MGKLIVIQFHECDVIHGTADVTLASCFYIKSLRKLKPFFDINFKRKSLKPLFCKHYKQICGGGELLL